MSQWAEIFQLGLGDFMWNFYRENFPVEIRVHLAQWIEDYAYRLNPRNPEEALYFATSLHSELQKAVQLMVGTDNWSLLARQSLSYELSQFEQKYGNNPALLLQKVQYCLDEEKKCIQNAKQSQNTEGSSNELGQYVNRVQNETPITNIQGRLIRLVPVPESGSTLMGDCSIFLNGIENIVVQIANVKDNISFVQNTIGQNTLELNGVAHLQLQKLQADLMQHERNKSLLTQQLQEFVTNWRQKMNSALMEIQEIIKVLLNELDLWKDEQRLEPLGFSNELEVSRKLEKIADLCNIAAEGLLEMQRQYNLLKECIQKGIESFSQPENLFQELRSQYQDILNLIHCLINKTFIVETQPRLIIRLKSIKPWIKVRLLVGPTFCNNHGGSKVKAFIISEDEAIKFCNNALYFPKITGEISSSEKQMSLHLKPKSFHSEFSGLKITKRPKSKHQKSTKEDTTLVTSEICYFYFTTKLNILNSEIQVSTISTPFTAATHPSQDGDAWPFSFWQTVFQGRKDVGVDDLLNILDKLFFKRTKRGLSNDNKAYLKEKLLRELPQNGKPLWDLFHTEKMSDCYESEKELEDLVNHQQQEKKKSKTKETTFQRKSISFANWFYAIMKLCSDNSKDNGNIHKEWAAGYVEGFISRKETETRLKSSSCSPNTIIVRFSDTILEGVTINWFNHINGMVEKLNPYQPEHLMAISLSKRIIENPLYSHIYPNHPKQVLLPSLNQTQDKRLELLKKGYFISTIKESNLAIEMGQLAMSRQRQYSSSSATSSTIESSNSGTQYNPFSPTTSTDSPLSASSPGFSGGFPSRARSFSGGQSCPINDTVDLSPNPLESIEEFNIIDGLESIGVTFEPSFDRQ